MKQTLTLFICLLFGTSFVFAQDGYLDPTFGNGGKVTTSIGNSFDLRGIAIQSDGKIVVTGFTTISGDGYEDFTTIRYEIDGSLDTTFGIGGKVITAIGSGRDVSNSLAIQQDGKIVVAGYSNNGSFHEIAVIRYNQNGSLDTSFSSDGKATTAISSSDNVANCVAIQQDGKIVVGGFFTYNSSEDFFILRYDSNGILDNSFGSDGIVTYNNAGNEDRCNSLAIQSDGKIVIAGSSSGKMCVIRLNTNGTFDNSFDSDGFAVLTDYSLGYGVAIQTDGKILVTGQTINDFIVVRYNSNGSLDNEFDNDGIVITDIGIGSSRATGIAIQQDDKIVVVGDGIIYTNGNSDFITVRYNSTGTIDGSFGSSGTGIITGQFTGSFQDDELAKSVAIQSDGKILVGGSSVLGFSLIRYENASTLPVELTSFSGSSNSGIVTLNWKTATETNNMGWEIERRQNPLNPPLKNGENWEKIGFVAGKGTTTLVQSYSFQTQMVLTSGNLFRLKQIDADGKFSYSNEIEINPENNSIEFELSQNYPNPFNPTTTINFNLPKSGKVVLKVFDVLGKEVTVLENGYKDSGRHSVNFDGSSLSSGLYFYKLDVGLFSQTKKLHLLK